LSDFKIEDTVLLLDASRSMLRKDFKPNRLNVALETIKSFIQEKLMFDPKDRIAIVIFGETTKKLCSFTNDDNILVDSFNKISISGTGKLYEGIAFSLQLLVEEMRKLGGKASRIFILSDNKYLHDEKLAKLANIAKGLHIYIDACQLGKAQDYSDSYLKKIAFESGGEYEFYNNSKALLNAGKTFAKKKEIKDDHDYFDPNKKDEIAPLVSEIALPLRRPTVLDIRLLMSEADKSQIKCQICHSVKSPITKSDFYSEGRYCPSCDRSMHLSCAAMWAKKTEYKENIFRCPFCYFLLELPASAPKLVEDKEEEETPKIRLIDESGAKTTKMKLVNREIVNAINASCSYCYNIFLGDFDVYKCENCGAYYHEPCLEKMHEEIKACRNCGSMIVFN